MLFPLKKSFIDILFAFSPCISNTCTIPSFAFINSPFLLSENNTVPGASCFSLPLYSFSSSNSSSNCSCDNT